MMAWVVHLWQLYLSVLFCLKGFHSYLCVCYIFHRRIGSCCLMELLKFNRFWCLIMIFSNPQYKYLFTGLNYYLNWKQKNAFGLQTSISVKPSSPSLMCCTGPLPLLPSGKSSSPKNESSSIWRVCSWGGLPLTLQAAHQSLDALQLVHRVLHRGFGRRGPPSRTSCFVIAVVLQSRAGLPAAWFGGFRTRVEATLQACREQAGALRQRHRELVGVEAEPGPWRAQEGVPGQGAGGAGGWESRGWCSRCSSRHVGVRVREKPSKGRHGDALEAEEGKRWCHTVAKTSMFLFFFLIVHV